MSDSTGKKSDLNLNEEKIIKGKFKKQNLKGKKLIILLATPSYGAQKQYK